MIASAAAQTRTRGHKKKERTRRQLIEAAVDVIADRGEAFTISDITDRAGVSNGTFYNYFVDREAVIDAIVPVVLRGFAVRSASAVEAIDPAVRFATITALALQRAVERPDEMRVVLRVDAVQREMFDGEILDPLRADLAAGVAAGRFSRPIDDATVHVLVGGVLMAARRILEADPGIAYRVRVVVELLVLLGVDESEAAALAEAAVAAAAEPAGT